MPQISSEFQKQRAREAQWRHGYACRGKYRPEYICWLNMIARCFKQNANGFANYGGRGISVCNRWRYGENGLSGFQCFIADMGDLPTAKARLDRKNNDGNYEPDNCQWVSMKIQMRNQRKTQFVEWQGQKIALIELCERLNRNSKTVYARIKNHGWTLERALTEPTASPQECAKRASEAAARAARSRRA